MYLVRAPGYPKDDPAMRWALPDRIFFACGACHILAEAFLERYGSKDRGIVWIRPKPGFSGNHVFVAGDGWRFYFHGHSDRARFLGHYWRTARLRWPGWDADLVELPRAVLTSTPESRRFPGLRLREPGQFLHDALPRARRFLDRFGPPP